ncbi:plasmid stabilization protein [Sphingobacterium cellulitidis]|uniref:type II toxin-antitoxin system RelE family toxin n=1 Tax=Sphingobacterium cellulitidis TaxID=1768011 RepID=UPI000B945BE9|nr:plasmid stabilization protein [Sphingobacterium cellulitidis]OYD46163.1 plasmid stabilization protein [Sphingobacterium cellulitidis]
MEIIFLRSFVNDIKKINDKSIRSKIKEFIIQVEKAKTLTEIPDVVKMKGFSTAYRFRIGEYRLGFFKYENTIELARFVKRNDIYKVFP